MVKISTQQQATASRRIATKVAVDEGSKGREAVDTVQAAQVTPVREALAQVTPVRTALASKGPVESQVAQVIILNSVHSRKIG